MITMKGRVAIITGAASGIGLALVKACLHEGMHVVMADINHTMLMHPIQPLSIPDGQTVLRVVCDVTNEQAVKQLAEQTLACFQRVDVLINNAGIIGDLGPLWELSTASIRHVLDTNLYGVINGIQAFLPHMLQQSHDSHVVNMASCYGLCSSSHLTAYAMSKHSIIALSESLYFDLQRLKKNIHVAVVCPSFTNTDLLINSSNINPMGLHDKMNTLIKHGRPAQDVADCILREIKQKTFYILPDHEVKSYCDERTQAIIAQRQPHQHSLEKIIASISSR